MPPSYKMLRKEILHISDNENIQTPNETFSAEKRTKITLMIAK